MIKVEAPTVTYMIGPHRAESTSSFELVDGMNGGAEVAFFNGYEKRSVYFPVEQLDAITDALIEFRRQARAAQTAQAEVTT